MNNLYQQLRVNRLQELQDRWQHTPTDPERIGEQVVRIQNLIEDIILDMLPDKNIN